MAYRRRSRTRRGFRRGSRRRVRSYRPRRSYGASRRRRSPRRRLLVIGSRM